MPAPVLERMRLPPDLDPEVQRVFVGIQERLEQALRRMVAGTPMDGRQLDGVRLIGGSNTVRHGLGRAPKGYIVVGQDGPGSVYDAPASNPDSTTYLLLSTDGVGTTFRLWVY